MKKPPFRRKPQRVLRLPDLRSRQNRCLKYSRLARLSDHIDLQSTTSLPGIALNPGSRSTKPLFSVTGCNSKLATCLHPRSMYAWLRFTVLHTKRLIAVCSAQNWPPAFAELRVPRNSRSASETGILHNKEKRFSAFLLEARSGASETLRCWHCCSVAVRDALNWFT